MRVCLRMIRNAPAEMDSFGRSISRWSSFVLQELCQVLYFGENLYLAFCIIGALNRETLPRGPTCLGAGTCSSDLRCAAQMWKVDKHIPNSQKTKSFYKQENCNSLSVFSSLKPVQKENLIILVRHKFCLHKSPASVAGVVTTWQQRQLLSELSADLTFLEHEVVPHN
jgi:hypothetical protein